MSYRSKTLITTSSATTSYGKRLSICLMPNGFSFSEVSSDGHLLTIGEADGMHAVSMTSVINDVKAFFTSVNIRPLSYRSIELIVLSNDSVWVPDDLYDSSANRSYLNLVGATASGIHTFHSDMLASTAVFSANDMLTTAFKIALPGLIVKHQHAKVAVETLCQRSDSHPVMLLFWRQGRLDIDIFRNGRYQYGNTLKVADDKDALYHIVEVMKTYGVDTSNAELLLCGDVDRSRYALVNPYFPKVTLFSGLVDSSSPQFIGVHTYRHALILM